VNALYDWGREASLSYFQELYKRLDTRIDVSFYESQVADDGMKIVEHWLEQGVFEKSDGAIIFPGEKYGLHSRVFITSQGLPTYEAKELGLTKQKFELHDFDTSIVITAPEQNDYFRVVLKAMEHIYPEIARRTKHLNNGLMRFASGKMSSRAGNVIAAEALISDIEGLVYEKIKDREFTDSEKKDLAAKVALGAIKYSILKQSVGRDIIFDPEKSISFEGDSGPYIQYTYVRAKSILAKAKKEGIEGDVTVSDGELVRLEKMLYLFPEIVERASNDEAPNYIATYLTALAGEFNSYYASTQVVDQKDPTSAHKVALTEGLSWVIKNGLWLLGIAAPEKM
jgi:arginyl-tRNA synthetase